MAVEKKNKNITDFQRFVTDANYITDESIKKILKKYPFTKEDYEFAVNLIMNEDFPASSNGVHEEIIKKGSKLGFNTPDINDKILLSNKTVNSKDYNKYHLSFGAIVDDLKFSDKALEKVSRKNKNRELDKTFMQNKHFGKDFFDYAYNNIPSKEWSGNMFSKMNQEQIKGIIADHSYNLNFNPELYDTLKHINFSSKELFKVMSNTNGLNPNFLNDDIKKMPKNERKKFMNDIVQKAIDTSTGAIFDNTSNWLRFTNHLNDDLIKNIINDSDVRNTQLKYNLFHNKNLPLEYAQKMHEKWASDESHDGYDRDAYISTYKEEDGDDNYLDDYYSDAQQAVEENYTLNDYLRDTDTIIGDYVDEIDGKDRSDWMADYKKSNPNGDAEQAWEDAAQEYVNDNGYPDSLLENYNNAISDDVHDKVNSLYDEDMENALSDYRHLPAHLEGKLPSVDNLKADKLLSDINKGKVKAAQEENSVAGMLDSQIPSRTHTKEYGEGQHLYELAKQHADNNKGKIDIGTMIKDYPNLKEKWKGIFGDKQNLTSEEIQHKIEKLPKHKYDITYRKWRPGLQNINHRDQVVMRLDLDNDTLKDLYKDKGLRDTFAKLQEVSQRSGHPTNPSTIAWARVDTTDPKHWMIDEVQSDFSSAARDYLHNNNGEEAAENIDKIIKKNGNWRETLIHHVLDLAKKHGVESVSTHTPESKAAHTGASKVHTVYKDSYQKVPRAMGFKSTSYENLPLNEHGQAVFQTNRNKGFSTKDLIQEHKNGMREHATNAKALKSALDQNPKTNKLTPEQVNEAKQAIQFHNKKYSEHHNRLSQLDPTDKFVNFKRPESFFDDKRYTVGGESWDKDTYNYSKNDDVSRVFGLAEEKGEVEPSKVEADEYLDIQPKAEEPQSGHIFHLSNNQIKKSYNEIYEEYHPSDFILEDMLPYKLLNEATKFEMETDIPYNKARELVIENLSEDPHYYDGLENRDMGELQELEDRNSQYLDPKLIEPDWEDFYNEYIDDDQESPAPTHGQNISSKLFTAQDLLTPEGQTLKKLLENDKLTYKPGKGIVLNEYFVDNDEGNSLGKAEQPIKTLTHYSKIPNLKELNPDFMGTGTPSYENRRGIPEVRRAYFYANDEKPEDLVTKDARSKYIVNAPQDLKIYDLATDKEGYIDSSLKENNNVWNSDKILQKIKDAGYHGFSNSDSSLPQVVGIFNTLKPDREEILK